MRNGLISVPGILPRSEAALKAKCGLILPARCNVFATNSECAKTLNTQTKNVFFPEHARDTSGIKVMLKLESSVSASPEEQQQLTAAERGIKGRCGRCSLALRSLDGGPNEATCTGSYSTRRGGMITSGCPGSSPRTPESSKEGGEY